MRSNGAIYVSQKCLWTKLQGNDQNFWIIPRIFKKTFFLMYKAAYRLKYRCCDSIDYMHLSSRRKKSENYIIQYSKCQLNVGHIESFKFP